MVDKKRTCFVIGPIGKADSLTRKRSDDLLKHIITPVMKELGIETERADRLAQPGNIPTQIIAKLNDADLVIADLTEQNANVFYELAIRHALTKPVIHMRGDDKEIPFDIHQYRTITYDTTDYNYLEPAKSELRRQAENQLKEPNNIVNPFTEALSFIKLKESTKPTENIIAELMEKINLVISDNETLKRDLHYYRRKSDRYDTRLTGIKNVEQEIIDVEGKIEETDILIKELSSEPNSRDKEKRMNKLLDLQKKLYEERNKLYEIL